MSLTQVSDVAADACLLLGAALCFVAGIGLLRLPDTLTRMHAATKPQVLGVLLVLLGLGLRLRSWVDLGTLVLIGTFQLMTVPVAAHIVARAAYRTGQVRGGELVRDELDERLTRPERPDRFFM
ncbi:monovalent cation/H(+) antiporter subunit G [Streptomyces sp. CA-111067]|jgi:multicomponent Na+:H+ antiporter subunit G|uniref:monovalent cation/H(+) antiporter subunit G n=1 Tax=Streptomyces sp. CA-111067 TaxID=3240046 RepID=UPI003D97634B